MHVWAYRAVAESELSEAGKGASLVMPSALRSDAMICDQLAVNSME
jgi:hypothetical protein